MDHAQARQIVAQAWQALFGRPPTNNELALAQAIAFMETGYGRKGQFAAMAANGQFNWGALERARGSDGTCPAGSTPGMDSSNPRCFLVFSDDVTACKAYLWNLVKNPHYAARTSATLAALATGDPDQVAQAMHLPASWYETSPASYAAMIRNGLQAIGSQVTPVTKGFPWGYALLGIGGAGAAIASFKLLRDRFRKAG